MLLGPRHLAAPSQIRSHATWVGIAFGILCTNAIYSTVVLIPGYSRQESDGRGAAAGMTLAATLAFTIPVALYHSWKARSDPLIWTYWGGAVLLLALGAGLTHLLEHSAASRFLPILPLAYALGTILLVVTSIVL